MSATKATYPVVLVDQPDEGYIEDLGWVEAIVDEDAARDALAEFCCDEQGDPPFRPVGPASRVHLRLVNPAQDAEYQRWTECKPTATTGREFWQVVVA